MHSMYVPVLNLLHNSKGMHPGGSSAMSISGQREWSSFLQTYDILGTSQLASGSNDGSVEENASYALQLLARIQGPLP